MAQNHPTAPSGSRANNTPIESLVLLNPTAANPASSVPHLICIGKNLSIVCGAGQINLSGIFVSPAGQISITLSDRPSEGMLSEIIAELQTWDCDRLNSIAADYTYFHHGQSFRIIDLMARQGHLSFADGKELSANINRCMGTGSFFLLCADTQSTMDRNAL